MKTKKKINQREHARFIADNLIKIIRPDGTPIEKPLNIQNLSEGGLQLVCYKKFEIGTSLEIEICLPNAPAVRLRATLIWLRPMKDSKIAYDAGVKFDDLPKGYRELLLGFINRYAGGKI